MRMNSHNAKLYIQISMTVFLGVLLITPVGAGTNQSPEKMIGTHIADDLWSIDDARMYYTAIGSMVDRAVSREEQDDISMQQLLQRVLDKRPRAEVVGNQDVLIMRNIVRHVAGTLKEGEKATRAMAELLALALGRIRDDVESSVSKLHNYVRRHPDHP